MYKAIGTETVWDKENGDVRQYVYCIASKAIKNSMV